MSQTFYRFRSVDKLIGDVEELDKQNVFFAHPKQLNDPMEDYKDLLFIGNEVIWESLFRHYFMCLEHVSQLLLLCGEEHCKIDIDSIPVFKSYDDFPTSIYKEHFQDIEKKFLDQCTLFIKKIICFNIIVGDKLLYSTKVPSIIISGFSFKFNFFLVNILNTLYS